MLEIHVICCDVHNRRQREMKTRKEKLLARMRLMKRKVAGKGFKSDALHHS